jgi:hypothetical protein
MDKVQIEISEVLFFLSLVVFCLNSSKFMKIQKSIEIVFWIQYPIYKENHFSDGGIIYDEFS